MRNLVKFLLAIAFVCDFAAGASSAVYSGVKGELDSSNLGASDKFATALDLSIDSLPDPSKIYRPRPALKGEIVGEIELIYTYEVVKTGKRDPESDIEFNEVYETVKTATGEVLVDREIKHSYHEAPKGPLPRHFIKFIKSNGERWVVSEYHDADGSVSATQNCFIKEIGSEAKLAFDAGEIVPLYLGNMRLDSTLGIFSDENHISSINGKPQRSRFISLRTGKKIDTYEDYDEQGRLIQISYLKDTVFVYLIQLYAQSGRIKWYADYLNGVEKKFDENGKEIK